MSRYDIPKYVLSEPSGRGTFTTKQLPRGTFSAPPKDWSPSGWAVPAYARGRYGQDPMVTKQLPRRTISQFAPDALQRRASPQIAMGSVLDGGSLGALGDITSDADPILNYGKTGAAMIVRRVRALPRAQRAQALKQALNAIDSSLNREVEKKALAYKAKGHTPAAALRKAIAASLSNNLAEEFVKLGKKQAPARGVSGLGAIAEHRTGFTPTTVNIGGLTFQGGQTGSSGDIYANVVVSSATPGWDAIKKKLGSSISSTIERYASVNTLGGVSPLNAIVTGKGPLKPSGTPSGHAIYLEFDRLKSGTTLKSRLANAKRVTLTLKRKPDSPNILESLVDAGTKAAAAVVNPIANGLRDAACQVAGSNAGKLAAVGAGATMGGPGGAQAAAAGVQVASSMCPGGSFVPTPPPPPPSFPIVPVAAAAGGLLVLFLVLK